jgi:hypothetical protein
MVHQLGGSIENRTQALAELKSCVAALQSVDLEQLPSEGIALTAKEVAHVAA